MATDQILKDALRTAKGISRRGYETGGVPQPSIQPPRPQALPASPQPRQLDQGGLYSKLRETLPTLQPKLTGSQAIAQLTKAGVKQDELKWSGLHHKLHQIGDKPTTRQEMMDVQDSDPLSTKAEILSNSYRYKKGMDEPKFSGNYRSPGGTNYRELLIKPEGGDGKFQHDREPFNEENHWPDHENIIASVRMQDMQTPEGKKATLADETQSDWAQQGRQHGFRGGSDTSDSNAITPGPYVDNTSKWAELAVKHSLYQAAQDSSDYFTWPKGEDVADRYKMRHVLDHLSYSKSGSDHWHLRGKSKKGENFTKDVPDDKLHDFVGAEMADRIRKGDIGSSPEVLPHDPSAFTLEDIEKQKEAHKEAIRKYSTINNERTRADHWGKRSGDSLIKMDDEAQKLRDMQESRDKYFNPGEGKVRALHPDYANVTQQQVWDVDKAIDSMKAGSSPTEYDALERKHRILSYALREKKNYEDAINSKTITGQDLDLGGHGHRKFYNEIYPQRVQEVMRKGGYGKADIGTVHLKTGEWKAQTPDTREYHGIHLTPELREKILQGGFPQYAGGGIVKKTMDNDVVSRAMRLVRDEDDFHDAKRIAGATNDERTPFASGGSLQGNPGIPSGQEGELPLAGGIRGGAGLREASPAGYVPSPGLEGLPTQVSIPQTGQTISAGPDHRIRAVAHDYMQKAGLKYNPAKTYQKVDPARAKRIAAAYDKMEHAPQNPLVRDAYAKMAEETKAQYQAAKEAGAKFEFWDPKTDKDPYEASPRLSTEDLKHNHHMFVYPTEAGFGSDEDAKSQLDENPLLADSGERWNGKKVTVNDMFRAIHDYYGHAKEGVGFRADGEENAWRSHAAMFSPLARLAMTSETRGQNSWLNYGPHGDKNKKARTDETVFADQKTGILPPWAMFEGAGDFLSTDDVKNVNKLYHERKSRGGEVKNGKEQAQEGNDRRGISQTDLGSGGQGTGGVLPADPQGQVTLSHWSHAPREVIDPSFAGSNELVRGSEQKRRGHDNFHKRTYWGVNGGYSPEGGIGKYRHDAKLSASDLYDLAGDPLNLKNKIGDGKNANPVNEIEHLIKSHGFKGYYRHHPELGSVAAIFHPIKPASITNEDNTKALSLTRDTDDVRDAMRLVGGVG